MMQFLRVSFTEPLLNWMAGPVKLAEARVFLKSRYFPLPPLMVTRSAPLMPIMGVAAATAVPEITRWVVASGTMARV